MANNIKESAGGWALQITKPARKADLIVEDDDGEVTRLAEVYVYGFDSLLLIIDAENVSTSHRADLVASAAEDTNSIHQGAMSSVGIAGNGYQVQLPGCREAGFEIGNSAPTVVDQGLIVIHNRSSVQLAENLLTIRRSQVSS